MKKLVVSSSANQWQVRLGGKRPGQAIVQRLELGRGDVPDRSEQPSVVEPVDPLERREFDLFEVSPGAVPAGAIHRDELDHLREHERIAPIVSTAHEGIFDLLEPLFEAGVTEKLRYLLGKRNRDQSRIEVARSKIATQRALAKFEVLTNECFSGGAHSVDSLARFGALSIMSAGSDMLLAVESTFDRPVKFDLGLMALNSEGAVYTSSCPAYPGRTLLEHWPFAIFSCS